MGQDKSWLEIGGRPMIEHVLEAAQGVAERLIIVISRDNAHTRRYEDLGPEVVFDQWDHCGPLGGIATALRHFDGKTGLMLACDLPFVTPDFLKFLLGIHESEGQKLTVPVDEEGRVQMLCGCYSPDCSVVMEAMLEARVYKAQRLLERAPHRTVGFEEYGSIPYLRNINTTEEYLAANYANRS